MATPPRTSPPPHDLIVLGGGSAGHAAAHTAAGLGLRCALVEAAEPLGGLCILRGCMPSKTLIETANRLRDLREAGAFAIRVEPAELDVKGLRERTRRLVEEFRASRVEEMQGGGYELIRGRARFRTPHEIDIALEGGGDRTLETATVVVATGSQPAIPELPGLAETPYWTSDDVVKLPRLPERLVVLGGGAIGMECAHLFEGLGSRVTVIVRSGRILREYDPELSAAMEAASTERGIRFLKETAIEKVWHDGRDFHLHLGGGGTVSADALLVATGRTPLTAGLGLKSVGVMMENGRILIDERATTSEAHIFAAGDCASPFPVVHLAVLQGEVAARNAARLIGEGHAISAALWNRDSAMMALFTAPQAVRIGLDETEAKARGLEPVSGRQDYADQGKGIIVGERHGFVKVVADRESRRLLGATGMGPAVAETAHLLQLAIEREMTVEDYLAVPHYHPTLAEAWHRAVEAIGPPP